MADPQGDSHMQSFSSSEDNDSDAMFPNDQQREQRLPGSNLVHSSELSPPHSQEALGPDRNITDVGHNQTDAMDTDVGDVLDDNLFGESHKELGDTQGSSISAEQLPGDSLISNEHTRKAEPGWAWKNRKARDEYNRAMEQVIDKNFSLKQFGDPFDDGEGSHPQKS